MSDIRESFYLDAFFCGRDIPSRVSRKLVDAENGIVRVGDVTRRTIPQLREAMTEIGIPVKDQDEFLDQLRRSCIFPSGINKPEEFALT